MQAVQKFMLLSDKPALRSSGLDKPENQESSSIKRGVGGRKSGRCTGTAVTLSSANKAESSSCNLQSGKDLKGEDTISTADMKSTKTSFSPVKTRSMRQNEVARVGMEESASETPDEELSLYSLYSSGCITRGQISRAKKMIGDVMQEHNAFSKMPDSRCSNREEEKMDLHHSNLPLQSACTSSKKLGKSLMKRRHDVSSEPSKFPEKKACKLLLGPCTDKKSTRNTASGRERRSTSRDDQRPRTPDVAEPLTAPSSPIREVALPEGSDEWLRRFLRWSAQEKIQALDGLINVCQPHEVRHMLGVIEPQFQRDFISLLPKELALHVLSFLEPRDLLTAAQTCKYWRLLAEDNLMWKEKCKQVRILEPYLPKVLKNSWRSKKNAGMGVRSAWKAAYLRHVRIEMNWREGKEKISKVLKGHDDHVITCLQFNGTRIVSGSDDNTLKVWSAVSGKCLRTLTGHTGGVWASQMRNNLIISGSTDRTLKIWNADTGHCVYTLYGHTSTVRCLALHEHIVVSGSRDATLRVWNIDTGSCLHVLMGHMAAVRCVCYDGRRVVSGAYDYMVKVWDPETEECLHTLQGHTNRVYSLQFDGTYVVSGSLDTSIRVWEVETGTCLHTLMGHQSLTSGMVLRGNILVSGNADSTVKVWDILTGECLKTLEGSNKHLSAVTCLQFRGNFIITSSDDGTVKLWDVETGKVIRDLVTLDSRGSGGVVWRIRASQTKLVCAFGSRNGTEETKLMVLDFDPDSK